MLFPLQKTSISKSQNDQIAIANAALDTGIGFLQPNGALPDPPFGPNDNITIFGDDMDMNLTVSFFENIIVPNSSLLLSQMAEFDIVTKQTKYKDRLKGYFGNFSPDKDV